MELDQRNTNEKPHSVEEYQIELFLMLFGDKYHSGKGFWTQLLCFFGDREAFPKTCSFRNEKLVVSGCAGFPSRDELGLGGGGGDDRRRPTGWCSPLLLLLGGGAGQGRWAWISHLFFQVVLCLPISFCWVVLLFSLLRWGGAAFSQGGAALLLLFLGVVVSSHNINKNI